MKGTSISRLVSSFLPSLDGSSIPDCWWRWRMERWKNYWLTLSALIRIILRSHNISINTRRSIYSSLPPPSTYTTRHRIRYCVKEEAWLLAEVEAQIRYGISTAPSREDAWSLLGLWYKTYGLRGWKEWLFWRVTSGVVIKSGLLFLFLSTSFPEEDDGDSMGFHFASASVAYS